jgi:UPF0716 protein FxsA
MPLLLFGLFLAVPLIEVVLFIQVGDAIGALWTVLACVATAAAGAFLVRRQGLATMASARQAMDMGRVPAVEAFDGICLVFAGALLLVPGFFTDAIGFLLLLPPFRHALRAWLATRVATMADVHVRRGPGGNVVEGEWEVVRDPAEPSRDPRLDPPRQ